MRSVIITYATITLKYQVQSMFYLLFSVAFSNNPTALDHPHPIAVLRKGHPGQTRVMSDHVWVQRPPVSNKFYVPLDLRST